MSEGQTTQNTAEVSAKLSPVDELKAAFEKKGRLVFFPGEDNSIFGELMSNAEANGISYKDWTSKAPDNFSGVALVTVKDDIENRLIAFPDKATALADPVVQDFMYNLYVRRVMRAAADDESSESQFVTAAGPLGVAFSKDAFSFQAKLWVSLLQEKGLKSIQVRSLYQALSSAPFAAQQFPRFAEWEKLISAMSAYAEKHGKSVALFAHFAATRDLVKDTGPSVTLGDNTSLEDLLAQAEGEADDEVEEKAAE